MIVVGWIARVWSWEKFFDTVLFLFDFDDFNTFWAVLLHAIFHSRLSKGQTTFTILTINLVIFISWIWWCGLCQTFLPPSILIESGLRVHRQALLVILTINRIPAVQILLAFLGCVALFIRCFQDLACCQEWIVFTLTAVHVPVTVQVAGTRLGKFSCLAVLDVGCFLGTSNFVCWAVAVVALGALCAFSSTE